MESLGGIDKNLINKPGGVLGIDSEGFYSNEFLPQVLGSPDAVTLECPSAVYLGATVVCKITNYDVFTTYVLGSNNVIVTRETDSIFVTGVKPDMDAWFSVNGSKFPIRVYKELTFLKSILKYKIENLSNNSGSGLFSVNSDGTRIVVSEPDLKSQSGDAGGKVTLYSISANGTSEITASDRFGKNVRHGSTIFQSRNSECLAIATESLSKLNNFREVTFGCKGSVDWSFQSFEKTPEVSNSLFGSSIYIDDFGLKAFVGDPGLNQIHVYNRTLLTPFGELSSIKKEKYSENQGFGNYISGNGDGSLIVVSDISENRDGDILIYEAENGIFKIKDKLRTSLPEGFVLGNKTWTNSTGTKIMANATTDGLTDGIVITYEKLSGRWSEVSRVSIPDVGLRGAGFGKTFSVSKDEKTLVVGAPGNDRCVGIAYIFSAIDTSWCFSKAVTALDSAPGDGFGSEVFVNENASALIVGKLNQLKQSFYFIV